MAGRGLGLLHAEVYSVLLFGDRFSESSAQDCFGLAPCVICGGVLLGSLRAGPQGWTDKLYFSSQDTTKKPFRLVEAWVVAAPRADASVQLNLTPVFEGINCF